MTRIGIIGAMDSEIRALISCMEEVETEKIASMTFYKGKLWGKDTVLVKCGVGKVNMTACTQILASIYKVGTLINTGVAGALKKGMRVGDIVISSDAVEHDMDATGLGFEKGVIPYMDESVFRADPDLVQLAKDSCRAVNPDVNCYVGRVVTGDQFISSRKVKNKLVKTFEGFCAEMEGAAMAQAAYLNGIPFVIIRAISDNADDSASGDFEEFTEKAVEHTTHLLEEMFPRLPDR
ncbi:MAG: 5'-methylthioadenosine/adenosylhomocysteine nucleosidase [Eubacterium sp.]|nr:5'-methylthioadenosine/adenosylhomocysteine nucleosidase [Eubacterium sp.]